MDLLKRILTRTLLPERRRALAPRRGTVRSALTRPLTRMLDAAGVELVREYRYDAGAREVGMDWPPEAETMMGLRRLDQLQEAIATVIREAVPGDLLEAGAWRGGGTIFMRAALEAFGDRDRRVWVADSFQGLPKPDPRYPQDTGDVHWTAPQLTVPLEQVRANFARYGLLDDRVRFLAGWFKDTLPPAPIDRLAVLRLDADMYESTTQAIEMLYPKLSPGGYCIVDDYGAIPACKEAVDDYRTAHGITEEKQQVDWTCVYWRRRS